MVTESGEWVRSTSIASGPRNARTTFASWVLANTPVAHPWAGCRARQAGAKYAWQPRGGTIPSVADDEFGEIPLAYTALAAQILDLLTSEERNAIAAYSGNAFVSINAAMRGEIAMTPPLARRIATIKSGLRKYPIPTAVRASRIVDAAFFGIMDDASVHEVIGDEFIEPAFLSTCGLATPAPTGLRPPNGVIADLIVPAGTHALRLGEIAEVPLEREVLIIDARTILPFDVTRDESRSMWRIQAVVMEAEL